MWAWANQGLELAVLAFGHEENSHNLVSKASTMFLSTQIVSRDRRLLFMSAFYVREVLNAEKKCDHCPPNQRSNYHDFLGDKYQIPRTISSIRKSSSSLIQSKSKSGHLS